MPSKVRGWALERSSRGGYIQIDWHLTGVMNATENNATGNNATENMASRDPMDVFRAWFGEAVASEPNDPNAVALATSTPGGESSVRMVLMKGMDERGFRFFTNAESEKGRQIAENPRASMCFHWKSLRRQVRLQGRVSELPDAETEVYFHSRSRRSQIGAAVSEQSRPLASREMLEERVRAMDREFPGEVPRPESWKGYCLWPERVEFWSDGPDRLHDRFLFERASVGWRVERLFP